MTALPVAAEQCTAKAKATGQRCQRRVRAGGVCIMHGGAAPQVRAKRQQRIALAKALDADPRRSPAEILSDVGHQADYLMRKGREEIGSGRLTPGTMGKLIDLADQAGRWAKANLDAGTAERQTRAIEAEAALLGGVVRRILDRLGLTDAQRALVPIVVPEELRRMAGQEVQAIEVRAISNGH